MAAVFQVQGCVIGVGFDEAAVAGGVDYEAGQRGSAACWAGRRFEPRLL